MKNFVSKSLGLLTLLSSLYATDASASQNATNPEKLCATVHIDSTGAEIHPFMYGMFTELLGNMFENGIHAEMLSDRKFFYPVDNSETLEPRNTRRHQLRWRPVGNPGKVVMDSAQVYVGKHSPKIIVDSGINGIRQSGLWLQNGMGYDGRIVLKGEPGTKVNVSLVWGPGAGDRSTATFDLLTDEYRKYPLHFISKSSTKDAYIEVTGEGKGSFNIGAVSLMPEDNINGFRRDLVDILRDVNATIYRWPGGNMLANYDWRHGIGDPDLRPPRYDYAWFAVESNDVGTDEFITLCRLIGAEPYLVVNIGFGDSHSAAEWVEYVNGSADTPMGKLRASNGHSNPYNVKYWGIGNEMYGEWQLGYMSSWHYSLKHNLFAEEMRQKDPDIKLVASGATIYETGTTARHHRKPLRMRLPIQYMSEDDWTGTLLKNCHDNIDYVAEHIYTYFHGHFDEKSQEWVNHRDTITDLVRRTPNRIKGMVEAMNEYESRLPQVKERRPMFWVDEWVAGDGRGFNTTLGVAAAMHEFLRHSDYVMMGAYTGFSGLYNHNDTASVMSSRGLMFKLYKSHHGNIPVKVTGNSPQPELEGTIGVDKPKSSSGSPTYPLDIMATINPEKTKLSMSIVNPTYTSQSVTIDYAGAKPEKTAKLYALIPQEITDENTVESPDVVKVTTSDVKLKPEITVPPLSIVLYEIPLKH